MSNKNQLNGMGGVREWHRDFWALAKPFWFSEEKWRALGLLGIILVFLGIGVYVLVFANKLNQEMYNALQNLDMKTFMKTISKYVVLFFSATLINAYRSYFISLLRIRWRNWLTDHLMKEWFSNQNYYFWRFSQNKNDNPDQRLTEDVNDFTDVTLNLFVGLFHQTLTLISFVAILWTLSGALDVPLWADKKLHIPGYMLWACLLYSLGGSVIMHWVGKPLVKLNYDQQKFEANFRFNLIRLREHSEGVALNRGEEMEKGILRGHFKNIYDNFIAIMHRQKKLSIFSSFYDDIASIFPIVVAAPKYFAKEIQLGGMMQTVGAFGRVQNALSYFINAYSTLMLWRAVILRLKGFRQSLSDNAPQIDKARSFIVKDSASKGMDATGASIFRPDGEPLVSHPALQLEKGSSTLITGPSGIGKSTFFRALAGVWPFSSGKLVATPDFSPEILPQRPYLPITTLANTLTYPKYAEGYLREDLEKYLKSCQLEALIPRLDETENWSQILSPGEQQRIAFIRLFLHKPKWVFLDEATSAMDEKTESQLYKMLLEEVPGVTVVSIGHRSTLKELHGKVVAFG